MTDAALGVVPILLPVFWGGAWLRGYERFAGSVFVKREELRENVAIRRHSAHARGGREDAPVEWCGVLRRLGSARVVSVFLAWFQREWGSFGRAASRNAPTCPTEEQ